MFFDTFLVKSALVLQFAVDFWNDGERVHERHRSPLRSPFAFTPMVNGS